MTIRTSDGSVYRLRGPNKLGKTQQNLDLSKLIFHNCNWNEEVVEAQSSPVPKESVKPVLEPKKAELEHEVIIEKIEPPKLPEPKEPEITKEPEVILQYKIMFHCLPAVIENRKDSFYGDSWSRLKYGPKFVFPGVLLEKGDLSISFWTNDPNQKVSVQSIIFPFAYEVWNKDTKRYDRVPFDEYRWWRVATVEQKNGGYVIEALPSDVQPDFSD